MNKQQLAAKIWESANKMRSKIEANEYKDYILGFMFYKYLSDKEVEYLKANDVSDDDLKTITEDDEETVDYIRKNNGYFISYENLFSTWIEMGRDFNVSNVNDALSAFSRLIDPHHKKLFDGIFDTLQTGLSKLGESSASQTKAISDLIHLIKDIPMDGKQDYDVVGYIYEYLIGMFASNAGKKAGEFYTPHEVSMLMSEIVAWHLRDKKEIKIYDPTSGSASLLINIGHAASKHMDSNNSIMYYAQELKQNTYNLTRMNLIMRGISPGNIITRNGDTLEEDWPYFDESDPAGTYDPLYVDAVVSNPPYSQNWDPENKENDPRYARFGIAPKAKADYAFLLHDLYHIKPDGIMTIVLPHGVLFRGGEEGKIRQNLIENNHIDAIIGLPANIFFGTGIPTIIMVLKQKRENTDILIIDASKDFAKIGKNNQLRASDIKKISDTVIGRLDIPKYSRKITREEIRENDYNLNIPRYVDSSEKAESWDIYASMFGGVPASEIDELHEFWTAFPNLRNDLFNNSSDSYATVSTDDIKGTIRSHSDVTTFFGSYKNSFSDFADFLKNELIGQTEQISISKEENIISDNIFQRMSDVPLIDKYEAFQLLDDEWSKISGDLEIIQTEGPDSARKVDPHMVIKKKSGKDQEIQEGWIGHIMPFELVQATLLTEETDKLKAKENRLSEISSEYEEILDSLSEEEKESDILNETNDAFVAKEIAKQAKIIQKSHDCSADDSIEAKILRTNALMEEEKKLKTAIKKDTDALHMLTKETIEKLTDEQVSQLLELKWITPLVTGINKLPENIINTLASEIQTLADKYDTTLSDIETQIHETEDILRAMINELTGSEFDMKGLSALQSLLKGE